MRTLPDLLQPGLDLIFVGINPGEASARAGHYYAHPGNGFWPALSASPLVARTVGPEDDRALLVEARIGFTDVVKRVITDSAQVSDTELRSAWTARVQCIAYAQARAVCFTSACACDRLFPRVRAADTWGHLPVTLAGAQVWVMPSTSGRAAAHRTHVHHVLAALAASLHEARATRSIGDDA